MNVPVIFILSRVCCIRQNGKFRYFAPVQSHAPVLTADDYVTAHICERI